MVYDQEAIMITGEIRNLNVLSAEAWFVGEVREQIFINLEKILWPNEVWIGVMSSRGAFSKKKYLGAMHAFVTSKDESTLKVALTVPVWNMDSFMRIKKKIKVPTMQLEEVP